MTQSKFDTKLRCTACGQGDHEHCDHHMNDGAFDPRDFLLVHCDCECDGAVDGSFDPASETTHLPLASGGELVEVLGVVYCTDRGSLHADGTHSYECRPGDHREVYWRAEPGDHVPAALPDLVPAARTAIAAMIGAMRTGDANRAAQAGTEMADVLETIEELLTGRVQ